MSPDSCFQIDLASLRRQSSSLPPSPSKTAQNPSGRRRPSSAKSEVIYATPTKSRPQSAKSQTDGKPASGRPTSGRSDNRSGTDRPSSGRSENRPSSGKSQSRPGSGRPENRSRRPSTEKARHNSVESAGALDSNPDLQRLPEEPTNEGDVTDRDGKLHDVTCLSLPPLPAQTQAHKSGVQMDSFSVAPPSAERVRRDSVHGSLPPLEPVGVETNLDADINSVLGKCLCVSFYTSTSVLRLKNNLMCDKNRCSRVHTVFVGDAPLGRQPSITKRKQKDETPETSPKHRMLNSRKHSVDYAELNHERHKRKNPRTMLMKSGSLDDSSIFIGGGVLQSDANSKRPSSGKRDQMGSAGERPGVREGRRKHSDSPHNSPSKHRHKHRQHQGRDSSSSPVKGEHAHLATIRK